MMSKKSSMLSGNAYGEDLLVISPPPLYSHFTVRRAFIVWMYLGQTNKFKEVCNYYHNLELLEETLPYEQVAASRHHEISMFQEPPGTSQFLQTHFPKLYSQKRIEPDYIPKIEGIKNERCLFTLEGFHTFDQEDFSTAEIINLSKTIRDYCNSQYITPRKFLAIFAKYANITGLSGTVRNVEAYIKRKRMHGDLILETNYRNLYRDICTEIANEPDDSYFEIPSANTDVRCEETNNLKNILGVNRNTTSTPNNNDVGEIIFKSCEEFFKSFNSNPQNVKVDPYASLGPKIEDFVQMYDKKVPRSKSVETVSYPKPNIINSLSFTQQGYYDSNVPKIHGKGRKYRKM